ncbi:glycosyltransferase [Leptolyngbya iicbica]|uniref:Dolichol-phosphate mannosyltransferase n=2 Tax=Cyanophyceae TaxID=3028117 RepID=A0A4Q7EGB1_9CYAN|nr:glycosyltransferase [Leptolyngbya sp. LK]RZM82631.1 glycosyltransferase [Leptolyngbya sp. LK]
MTYSKSVEIESQQRLVETPSGKLIVPSALVTTTSADGIVLDVGQGTTSHNRTTQKVLFSLVIPTFNERDNLQTLVAQLTSILDTTVPGQYELIVVDDDSPDETWQIGLELAQTYPQVRVMRRVGEKGLSSAVIRGWQVAQGEILGVIDADLQHPPQVLLDLIAKVRNGADLAVGSRHVEGGGVSEWSIVRRFLSRGAQVLGLLILPNVVGRVSDPMSGYFVCRRAAIADTELNPRGYKILLEVIGRGNFEVIDEAGYVFQERTAGASKVTWKQYVDYIHHLLRLRSRGRIGKIRRNFPTKAFFRFALVGLSGVFIDMAVLYLLHTGLGLPLTRSKILAAEVAILNNFVWNDLWTFATISRGQKGWGARLKRFLKFNMICLAGLVLNVLVLNLIYNLIFGQRWAYVANLIAIGLVTVWNFWLNLKLSWRVTQVDRQQ